MGNKNGQVFVLSQEIEEEAGHLVNLPPFLPGHGPFPYLSASQGVYLLISELLILEGRKPETRTKGKECSGSGMIVSLYSCSLGLFPFPVSAKVSVYNPPNNLTKVGPSQIRYTILFVSVTAFISICPVCFLVVSTLQ